MKFGVGQAGVVVYGVVRVAVAGARALALLAQPIRVAVCGAATQAGLRSRDPCDSQTLMIRRSVRVGIR